MTARVLVVDDEPLIRSSIAETLGSAGHQVLEAADRFDGRHGATFTTFAYYRVRGAIFDGPRHAIGYVGVVLMQAPQIAKQWERGVVLRFGRFIGLRGPGETQLEMDRRRIRRRRNRLNADKAEQEVPRKKRGSGEPCRLHAAASVRFNAW
mgnify:CR=1 FL=1